MQTGNTVTMVLADEQGIIREGIAAYCRTRFRISILGQCSDGEEAIELIVTRQPDVAIFDLRMPTRGGLDIVRRVRESACQTRLIVLAVTQDRNAIRTLFESGANGYVLKTSPAEHLCDAIVCVLQGDRYLTPLLNDLTPEVDSLKEIDPLAMLSRREYQVFSFLAEGMRPRDIASELRISPKTVDTYRANVVRKLEIDGVAGMVRFAIQRGLKSPPHP